MVYGKFRGVSKANEALSFLATAPQNDSIEVMKAESRFMRALYYFNLVRAFGGMPIVDHKLEQDEQSPARSSLAATYDFIREDLEYAAPLLRRRALPEQNGTDVPPVVQPRLIWRRFICIRRIGRRRIV